MRLIALLDVTSVLKTDQGRCYLHALLQGLASSGGTTASGSRGFSEQDEERVFREARQLWHNGVHADLKVTLIITPSDLG
jgi:hypothetical protein